MQAHDRSRLLARGEQRIPVRRADRGQAELIRELGETEGPETTLTIGDDVGRREFWIVQPGDLAGAILAISATDDSAVNRQVWEEGRRSSVLVNVVDDVPLCDFIAPSVIRQGDLTVAISTSGKAPALAVRIRECLEEAFGPEYARFLELAGAIRQPLVEKHPDFKTRRTRWYELVDSDILDLLRSGDEAAAYQKIEAIMGVSIPHDLIKRTKQVIEPSSAPAISGEP